METPVTAAAKGRPREFCVDQALAAALGVFWAKGYESASMADLTEAMGITKPSLYAAFGNKEALFHKALELYEVEKLQYTREALNQPTARAVAEHFMRGAIDAQMSSCDPKGCLGVISMTARGAEAESIKADVMQRRASSQAALVERFEQATSMPMRSPSISTRSCRAWRCRPDRAPHAPIWSGWWRPAWRCGRRADEIYRSVQKALTTSV
jgi:AcrR family transcriptional regulator